jgi:DNA polymerase type B, organellar and viral
MFDGIFILINLVKMKETMSMKIEPLFRDRKLISIKVKYGYRNSSHSYRYSIEFRDSLLILMSPLSKLIKFFISDNVEFKNYKDNSKDIINALIGNKAKTFMLNISFRKKLVNYCINDCKALALIIYKFSELIFNVFKMNVHDYPTISSLALAIFRTHFLKSDTMIPKISGQIYKDISQAYTGGHVDVYKLYSNEETHSYDIVSLYPTVMLNNEFPVGKITHFIGNILSEKLNFNLDFLLKRHAFVKCDIFVDKSLNKPVYQTHIMLNRQKRTLCATGTFLNQWIYVPELIKYQLLTNNKIRIIEDSIKEGYLFESKKLFSSYIDPLFKLKNSVSKSDPKYRICKLLLNSLYGRFGLKQIMQIYQFVNNFEIHNFTIGNDIKDIIDLVGTNK